MKLLDFTQNIAYKGVFYIPDVFNCLYIYKSDI